jgi:hypothetical protein
LVVALVIPLAVAAGTVTVPNTFTNGTAADADAVNANFDAVEAAVNDNDSRITTAQSTADSNAAGISSAFPVISGNTTSIAALQAQLAALEALVESYHPTSRFIACVDGLTVADTATGLLWERKTTTGDVHDVFNTYTWSTTGTAADGTAYTVFLAGLNGASFAGHTNWRLPFISELQSILVGSGVTTVANADPPDTASGANATGQPTTCSAAPCIDPDFAAVGGPTLSAGYWSASTFAAIPTLAWFAGFDFGGVGISNFKTVDTLFLRAVRAGSCSS